MLGLITIAWYHWVGFLLAVLLFLALDLGVFHRQAHVVRFKEAFIWTAVWFSLAMLFTACLRPLRGPGEAADFLTGYLIELSLSMDNVFAIALIFEYFKVPSQYQHRVLFWGILGALVMRGTLIWLGSELIMSYHWILHIFGVFLVLTAIKMILADEEEVQLETNPVLKLARKYFHVTADYEGPKFFTLHLGRRALTPLALVLLLVETTDMVFALDSIPAIFAVTTQPFIVFTSNVFAILGLRSLFFLLAGAIAYFRYLKYGLSVVLGFVGFKMLLAQWVKISSQMSLSVVVLILAVSMVWSVFAARRVPPQPPSAPPGPS